MEKVVDVSNGSDTNEQIRVLQVMWKDYVIGYLMKYDQIGYLFKYNANGLKSANSQGFPYLIGFKDTRKAYASKKLFPVFQSRIPSRQRRDLNEKLQAIGLDEYDEFSYLALTQGRLSTDHISFEEIPFEKLKIKSSSDMMNRNLNRSYRPRGGRSMF